MPSTSQNTRLGDWVRQTIPEGPLTCFLACAIGIFGGFGALLFTWLINSVGALGLGPLLNAEGSIQGLAYLLPVAGLLLVAWLTRRFAPEAEGHGVPEVIFAVARRDGVIRPRVSVVKTLASAFSIGTGGSVGREGPIVQIGSSVGSSVGQFLGLSPAHVKVLVACGAAAGISATFNAPLAGVIFASEIILGSFAVQYLTPIVLASVLADVVQKHYGEYGLFPVFRDLNYEFVGGFYQLVPYALLGLVCGLFAVSFTKLVYIVEDAFKRIQKWWARAIVAGLILGAVGFLYPRVPPSGYAHESHGVATPPVFGVGYQVVEHALHLRIQAGGGESSPGNVDTFLAREDLLAELRWLAPLVLLKLCLTSVTLAGGGSGGIFAPSLFLGATVGGCFGLMMNVLAPTLLVHPGAYAIVGMASVVAGTTHGLISAILIVYEMTGDYRIILPLMVSAGIASVLARAVDHESIYHKKLSRRGRPLARGHDLTAVEHVMVHDLMVPQNSWVQIDHTLADIIRFAQEHPALDSLPVANEKGQLLGIIHHAELEHAMDSDLPRHLVNASDLLLEHRVAVARDDNLLEALREFGVQDIDSIPVLSERDGKKRLVGLLFRADVMRRYRRELLAAAE